MSRSVVGQTTDEDEMFTAPRTVGSASTAANAPNNTNGKARMVPGGLPEQQTQQRVGARRIVSTRSAQERSQTDGVAPRRVYDRPWPQQQLKGVSQS